MRHHKHLNKLNRSPSHRRAVLRNLAGALIQHERIETTITKAKALKRVADKLVTLGKNDTLHSRRNAMSFLPEINRTESGNAQKRSAVHKLFTELAPRFAERNGGYTRVVRSRRRVGDNAQLAIIEFVEETIEKKTKERKKRRVRKKSTEEAPKQEAAAEEVTSEEASDEAPAEESSPAPEEEAKEEKPE